MSSIVPRNISLRAAKQFRYLAGVAPDGPYYVWVGNPVDPSIDKDINDDVYDVTVEPYAKMAFGVAVTANDVALMVREVPYVANVVYAQYDDSDPLLFDKDFYVTVTSGDFIHAFKCLYNNNGIPSTAAPDIGDVDPGDIVYQTSDGYQWKYMFTIEDVDVLKFSTPGYIPVTSNSEVVASAVSGALDVIIVTDEGEGYRNYLSGIFDVADLQVGGNGHVYSLAGNSSASSSNGFYTGCMLYLASGAGAGGYRTVTDYVSNSSGKFVHVDEPFVTAPGSGTGWELSPEVVIVGGDQTSDARARAIVNAVGNVIHRVEMLDRGAGYSRAEASVVANSVVGVTMNAAVRPIYGPPGGHGYDPPAELGVTRASVSVRLLGTISNTVPGTGRFGQHGLMSRPVFASANLGLSVYGGVATEGSTYQVLDTVRVEGGASVMVGANTITCNTGAFDEVFSVGDSVLVKDGVTDRYLGVVTAVNSSVVQVATDLGWTSSNVTVYTASTTATCVITDATMANDVAVGTISGFVEVGDDVIVGNGGHWGTVVTVTRSGVSKGYSTFVQMVKVVGSYVSGTLQENEVVYQGDSLANASFTAWAHSIQDDGGTITVYMTDVFGAVDVDLDLKGNTSSAILDITDRYLAEVVPGTGTILYVENHTAVGRDLDQAEELNLMIEF